MGDLIETKLVGDSSKRPSKRLPEKEKLSGPVSLCDDGLDSFFLELDIEAAIQASKEREASLTKI